jgi:hypothetical protein
MDEDNTLYWLGLLGVGAAAYWYFYMKPKGNTQVPLTVYASQYQPIVKGLIDAGWTIDAAGNASNPKTGEKYNIYQA